MKPSISVVISTYNNVPWLEKVLWGYAVQTTTDFEIIIADDGSTSDTKDFLSTLSSTFPVPIIHVWQEDKGFQKTKILNKALLKTTAEYLLFTDGDCIPREDFVETHLRLKREGYFLSGGYFKLPMSISKMITKDDIISQRCFKKSWLRSLGIKRTFKTNKLTSRGLKAKMLNRVTTTKATWDGCNASGFKKDIIKVNGFDERMQYGGEDRELGERLMNLGIKGKQIRYSAICLHLDHERGYVDSKALDDNLKIRIETKRNKKTYTDFGIVKTS